MNLKFYSDLKKVSNKSKFSKFVIGTLSTLLALTLSTNLNYKNDLAFAMNFGEDILDPYDHEILPPMIPHMSAQIVRPQNIDDFHGDCSATEDDHVNWQLVRDDDAINFTLVISGTGNMRDYQIYNAVPWYQHKDNIKTLIIRDGVEKIGNCAFYHLKKLTSAEISDDVIIIGNRAFAGCISLNEIELPNVRTIDDKAFMSCGLTSIEAPNVEEIKEKAFECSDLETIALPSATVIHKEAFSYCGRLESVELTSVIEIGEQAFYGCSNLETVVIPQVNSLGFKAFCECRNLNTVRLPNNAVGILNAFNKPFINFDYIIVEEKDFNKILTESEFWSAFYLNPPELPLH